MQEARLPGNEASRVEALRSLGILDTPPEDRFDRYTRITAKAFDVPIALISLVDHDRQWFKSAKGLDTIETPRSISFCGHAILGDGVFEVQNALHDPRFRDNPLVVDAPEICFYAGAPLESADRYRLGTLCIIDRVPRRLSADEKTMLRNLADMVAAEMTRFCDLDTDRSARKTQTITGAEFFESIPDEPGLSVLLFDIDDVLESHDDSDVGTSPGEIFGELLLDHFPTARSIAHIGDYHFCVLLKPSKDFDEVRAINHVCSAAKGLLCFADGHESLTPFVGHLHYNSSRYASVNDMLRDADRMFLMHEAHDVPNGPDIKGFIKEMVGWRKTIF